MAVGESTAESGPWTRRHVLSQAMTVTLFPSYHTIQVALEEEELDFHPFFDAYNSFLVTTPTKFSWSLAPLNGLKTPYPALRLLRITKRVVLELLDASSFSTLNVSLRTFYRWDMPVDECRLKDKFKTAALRLWLLEKEPHILPLYGTKRSDKGDGIPGEEGGRGVTCERSTLFESMLQTYRGRRRGPISQRSSWYVEDSSSQYMVEMINAAPLQSTNP
ncbi:hypothetical protein ARMSODRAFT_983489 [Armillaria solidipes]|uniref:Uncharacterized protein n=1 Tax=Armillaria solidipes TaxID=1076256 RepID=A0A2H3B4X9_9AGAR|nr:hypothetical protein ARMSODRAFT_983489 [Armillaria solidipes]